MLGKLSIIHLKKQTAYFPMFWTLFQLCSLAKQMFLISSLVQIQLANTAFCDKFASLIQQLSTFYYGFL